MKAFDVSVAVFVRGLTHLKTQLTKAESHAVASGKAPASRRATSWARSGARARDRCRHSGGLCVVARATCHCGLLAKAAAHGRGQNQYTLRSWSRQPPPLPPPTTPSHTHSLP